MRSPVILRVFRNDQLQAVKQFEQDQIVIGHDAEVHLELGDTSVSPIHCLIEHRDSGYYICDMGSQTGTFKNGQTILDEKVESGDEIFVGPFKIVFYVGAPKPKAVPTYQSTPASTPIVEPVAVAPVAKVTAVKSPEPVAKAEIPVSTPASAKEESVAAVHRPEIKVTTAKGSKRKKKKQSFAPPSEIKDLSKYLKPGKGPRVEVLVAWKERIINSYHLKNKTIVRIGQGEVAIPEDFAPRSWPLVVVNQVAILNLTADHTVEVVTSDTRLAHEVLAANGRLSKTAQGATLRLEQNEMAVIKHRDHALELYVRYKPATTAVPMIPMMLSGSELAGLVASLVTVALLALYISATTPKEWEEEKQEQVQRVAQIIFNEQKPPPPPLPEQKPDVPPPQQPPKPPPPEKPKKVVVSDKDQEATKKGANTTATQSARNSKAGQASDVRPKPNSANRPKKFTSTRQGGAIKTGAEGANAQSANKDVSKIGLFSALSGGGSRAKLDQAYTGAGEILGMAGNATGSSGFKEDRAGDDLGSRFKDTGAGGKGTATQGIAGLGTKGRGSGQAAYGAGDGFGDKDSVAIQAGGSEEDFIGTIDREAIRRVIQAKINEVRGCYERVLNTLPRGQRLEGKVIISWEIVAQGAAKNARVKSSTLGNAKVENCIRDRLASWTFPEPPEGMTAEVAYPFQLKAN